jgi:hypothetical protein
VGDAVTTIAVLSEDATDCIVHRDARPSDLHFFLNSWLRSQRLVPPHHLTDNRTYFGAFKARIERLLRADKTTAIVAVNVADAEQIYGYIVYEPGVVHFAYVKSPFRRFGICRSLVNAAFPEPPNPLVCTSSCGLFANLQHAFNLEYNPWLLEEQKETK